MKGLNRKFILIILLIGIILMTGCDKINFRTFDASEGETTSEVIIKQENTEDETNKKSDQTNTSKTDSTTTGTATDEESTTMEETSGLAASPSPTPVAIQPTANTDLSVYTVDPETGDVKPVVAMISTDSEINPSLIVETVLESLADQSIIVGVKDVTTEDNKIIVNFDKELTPYNNMGSGYEAAILNAIAQSLIDNSKVHSKVIYRVDDKAYESGVFSFGINEVYMGDN